MTCKKGEKGPNLPTRFINLNRFNKCYSFFFLCSSISLSPRGRSLYLSLSLSLYRPAYECMSVLFRFSFLLLRGLVFIIILPISMILLLLYHNYHHDSNSACLMPGTFISKAMRKRSSNVFRLKMRPSSELNYKRYHKYGG